MRFGPSDPGRRSAAHFVTKVRPTTIDREANPQPALKSACEKDAPWTFLQMHPIGKKLCHFHAASTGLPRCCTPHWPLVSKYDANLNPLLTCLFLIWIYRRCGAHPHREFVEW